MEETRKTRKFSAISPEGERVEFEVKMLNKGALERMAQGPPQESPNQETLGRGWFSNFYKKILDLPLINPDGKLNDISIRREKENKILSFLKRKKIWIGAIVSSIIIALFLIIRDGGIVNSDQKSEKTETTRWHELEVEADETISIIAQGLKDESSVNRHTTLLQLEKDRRAAAGYLCWSTNYDPDPYNRLTAMAILLNFNLSYLSCYGYGCKNSHGSGEYMVDSGHHDYNDEWYADLDLQVSASCPWRSESNISEKCKAAKQHIANWAKHPESYALHCIATAAKYDESSMVRKIAVLLLSYTNESWLHYLKEIMTDDTDAEVRKLAIEAIGVLKDKKVEKQEEKK